MTQSNETASAQRLGFGLIVGGLASIASVIGRAYLPDLTANIL